MPELPTISESLNIAGFDLRAWTGLFGPANMPKDVTVRLSTELFKIVTRQDIRSKLLTGNMEPTPQLASEFIPFLANQYTVWGSKIKEAGIEPE